jgi:hypothetical protein
VEEFMRSSKGPTLGEKISLMKGMETLTNLIDSKKTDKASYFGAIGLNQTQRIKCLWLPPLYMGQKVDYCSEMQKLC